MDDITYYKKPGGKAFVYWVVEYKWKGMGGQKYWGWKIVGAQLRPKLMRREIGFVSVYMPPAHREFDCNPNHIPLPAYVFNKKREAEGWLKLTCERWEPEG